MTKVSKMLGSAGLAAILAFLIVAFAAIGPPGHNAKAASFSDQSMYATSLPCTPSLVSNVDLTHPPNVTAVTFAMNWSTGTTTAPTTAFYVSSRVTPYALVGFGFLANNTNNSQVASGNGSVFESPVSSTSSSNSQSGLHLGADSVPEGLTSSPGTLSPASIQAISGQNSSIQSAIITLCVLLSALIAVLILASYTLRPGYVFGLGSPTPFGNGWIIKRFGAPMLRTFAFVRKTARRG